MTAIASRITSLAIVYSTVYSGAHLRKHQSSASLAFVRGIHRGPVNFPHKWPVTRKMFPFDDVIMTNSHERQTYWWTPPSLFFFAPWKSSLIAMCLTPEIHNKAHILCMKIGMRCVFTNYLYLDECMISLEVLNCGTRPLRDTEVGMGMGLLWSVVCVVL